MKQALLFLYFISFSVCVQAQIITGRVMDARTHEALPFVSISIKNTTKGTLSKEDGSFEIDVPNKDTELIFSSIGYFSKVLKARNSKDVYLEEKESSLNEVVVFSINPANRIIESAVRNKVFNDPEKHTSFRYEVYHKSIVSANVDSLNVNKKLGKRLENNDLFVNESYATHKFIRPNLNKEIIIGSRTSGTKSTLFSSLTPMLQQFGFYRDFIQFQGRQLQEQLIYVNPLSEGTLGRYDFTMLDTLINDTNDSTFVIDFEPKRKSNFVGLRGTLHIHSGDYALQYVRAEPAETNLLHFKLEQIYEKINGKSWFPTELSAEWLLSEFKVGGQSLRFNIRSSLKDIELDVPIPVTDFDENSLEFKSDAIFQDEAFWQTHRSDSLSLREKNTYLYHASMSLGKKIKQTAVISGSEWLMSGAIPLGKKLDLSIQNLFDANVYEGFRPTLNVLTNDNFSKFIRLDAKAGYGFGDQAFKYEGRVRFNLIEKYRMRLSLAYRSDISEPANVQFFIWNFPQIPYELIRTFQIARADSLRQWKAELNFRALRYGTFSISMIDEFRKPTYGYSYCNPMKDPSIFSVRDFRTTEIGVGLRYAFGEEFSQIGRGAIITTPPSSTFSLHIAQGVLHLPQEKVSFTKLNTKLEYRFKTLNLGETFINLSAGKIWGSLPYPYLYNGRGSRDDNNIIWVANHFQTMGLYEFTSDQYANLFITHSFGSLLSRPKTKWFRPEVAVFQGIAVGSLSNRASHEGIAIKGLEEGYFESGLMVDNLIRKRFAKLFYLGAGIGVFRRWGANELPNTVDNWTYRLVWNVAF
jgi:Family of unknown function (DUF5686)/CarboxypepD_reg-like domain